MDEEEFSELMYKCMTEASKCEDLELLMDIVANYNSLSNKEIPMKKYDTHYNVDYNTSSSNDGAWGVKYDCEGSSNWGSSNENTKARLMAKIEKEEMSLKELRAKLRGLREERDKLIEKGYREEEKIAKAAIRKYRAEHKETEEKIKAMKVRVIEAKQQLKDAKTLLSKTEKEVSAKTKEIEEIIKQIEFTESEIEKREEYNHRKHSEMLDWVHAQDRDIRKRKEKLAREMKKLEEEERKIEARREQVLGMGTMFAQRKRVVQLDLDDPTPKKDDDAPIF
jgi:hypothetical protein